MTAHEIVRDFEHKFSTQKVDIDKAVFPVPSLAEIVDNLSGDQSITAQLLWFICNLTSDEYIAFCIRDAGDPEGIPLLCAQANKPFTEQQLGKSQATDLPDNGLLTVFLEMAHFQPALAVPVAIA